MSPQDRRLLDDFEACTLPIEHWNHRAHVSVAFLYLHEHGYEEALNCLRRNIQALNRSHGVEEGPTSGYNETTTVAFLRLIKAVMDAYGGIFPVGDAAQFCETHPQLMCKQVLRLYYSPERRGHPEAKHRFIEPDLSALPR